MKRYKKNLALGFKGNVLFFKLRVIEMAPRTKALASNPANLSLRTGTRTSSAVLHTAGTSSTHTENKKRGGELRKCFIKL